MLILSLAFLWSCGDDDEEDPQAGIVGAWRLINGEITINDLSVREYYK